MDFRTIDDVLDFAIRREEAAAQLYESMAQNVERPEMRAALLDFAEEEKRHKQRLLKIKQGELPAVSVEQIADLKIAEYVELPDVNAKMDYPDALRFAMNSEKAAFRLYSDLAAISGPKIAAVFRSLAQEEAKHKLRFEVEYDDNVLRSW
jgi:rubrerythrin